MDAVQLAELVAERGIVGNANQGGRRQATIIEQEAWQTMMQKLSADISPAARRDYARKCRPNGGAACLRAFLKAVPSKQVMTSSSKT